VQCETNICGLAWAVRQKLPFEPLLVFSAASLIYVFNVKTRQIIGSLRGHGGVSVSCTLHLFSVSDIWIISQLLLSQSIRHTLTSFAVLLVILRHGYTTYYLHLCKHQIICIGLLGLGLALQVLRMVCT